MNGPAARWQARILDADGATLGAGVLISARHVLTCAHVLGTPGTFTVDFPRSPSGVEVTATVATDGWFPGTDDTEDDIAILELDGRLPDGVEPAEVGHGHASVGRAARMYGHPRTAPRGLWAHGEIVDTTGPRGGWMQIGRLSHYDERVAPGFSGCGVWAPDLNRVVGIVVAAHTSDRHVAWMIPMEVVAAYWPLAGDWLAEESEPDDALAESVADSFVRMFERYRAEIAVDRWITLLDRLPSAVAKQLPAAPVETSAVVRACRRHRNLRILADLIRYEAGPTPWGANLDELLSLHNIGRIEVAIEQVRLSDRDRDRLYRALLDVPSFQNARTRHGYFDGLRDYLHRERDATLDLPYTDDAGTDARALVRVCDQFGGLLRLFLDVIPNVDRGQPGFRELHTLIEGLSIEQLLTDAERDGLVALIAGVAPPVLLDAFRIAAPLSAVGSLPELDHPDRVVRHIEGYAHNPVSVPRIVVFAEAVAYRHGAGRDRLERWSELTAARLRCYRKDLMEIRAQLSVRPDRMPPPTMVVQLAPDSLEPDGYLFAASLDAGPGRQRVIASQDEPHRVGRLLGQVGRHLVDVYRLLEFNTDRLSVEVIVPRSLLTEPVDQWLVTDGVLDVAMGTKIPVVLRSYERITRDELRPEWRKKWRLAREQAASAEVLHFVPSGAPRTAVQVRHALSPDEKLLLAMGEPPARQRELQPADAYAGALSAGVAYIAWVRDPALAEDFRRELVAVLRTTPLHQLPEAVLRWRQAADPTDPAALGNATSLMVCDEQRIPEQFIGRALRPPPRRGSQS